MRLAAARKRYSEGTMTGEIPKDLEECGGCLDCEEYNCADLSGDDYIECIYNCEAYCAENSDCYDDLEYEEIAEEYETSSE